MIPSCPPPTGGAVKTIYVAKVIGGLALSAIRRTLAAPFSTGARAGLQSQWALLREHLRPRFYRTPLSPPPAL